jgi:hypothetical protein
MTFVVREQLLNITTWFKSFENYCGTSRFRIKGLPEGSSTAGPSFDFI